MIKQKDLTDYQIAKAYLNDKKTVKINLVNHLKRSRLYKKLMYEKHGIEPISMKDFRKIMDGQI